MIFYFHRPEIILNNPFDPERARIIHIEFDIVPGGAGAGQVTVALNWSTPEWSAPGYVDSLPLVPNEAIPEENYIIREAILGDPAAMAETVEASHIIFDFLFHIIFPLAHGKI
ncbi:MAG: hypothetical protein R6U43_10165 [Candidatus Krumholzibacteriales bacterium]